VILVFCPMRASSANHTSIGWPAASWCPISARHAAKFFKRLKGGGVLGVVARAGRKLAIAQAAQHPAQRLLADRNAKLGIDPLRQINQPPAARSARSATL
jgi:hypothetical protein